MFRPYLSGILLAASPVILMAQLCVNSAVWSAQAQLPSANPPAQTATKTTDSPNPAASPTTPAAAPAVATPANPGTQDTDPVTAKKTRKVWTNEDVSGMRGPISIVGDGRNAKGKNAPQTPADPAYISGARKKLQDLQEKMAAADKELASLKDFSEGEPVATADREFHKSYNNEPIAEQVSNLQAKKIDLQSKIDALLDEARKKGVEPGQLR